MYAALTPAPSSCVARTRPASCAAPLLAVVLLGGGFATAADDVDRAVATIEKTFTSGGAAGLRPVLPSSGKVFVSLPSVAATRGYLDTDPLLYLLDETLRTYPTRSFTTVATETEPTRARVRARWEFAVSDTETRSVEIRFLLSREDGRWYLREIRESYRG